MNPLKQMSQSTNPSPAHPQRQLIPTQQGGMLTSPPTKPNTPLFQETVKNPQKITFLHLKLQQQPLRKLLPRKKTTMKLIFLEVMMKMMQKRNE
jgi:hypothetical protein